MKIVIDGSAKMLARREGYVVGRAALRTAMSRAVLGAPGDTMLTRADAMAQAISDAEARIAWTDVYQFIRLHPNVLTWGPAFGLTPEALDALFLLAMAIERGAPDQQARLAALLATL